MEKPARAPAKSPASNLKLRNPRERILLKDTMFPVRRPLIFLVSLCLATAIVAVKKSRERPDPRKPGVFHRTLVEAAEADPELAMLRNLGGSVSDIARIFEKGPYTAFAPRNVAFKTV